MSQFVRVKEHKQRHREALRITRCDYMTQVVQKHETYTEMKKVLKKRGTGFRHL